VLALKPGINLIGAIPVAELEEGHPLLTIMDALGIERLVTNHSRRVAATKSSTLSRPILITDPGRHWTSSEPDDSIHDRVVVVSLALLVAEVFISAGFLWAVSA